MRFKIWFYDNYANFLVRHGKVDKFNKVIDKLRKLKGYVLWEK